MPETPPVPPLKIFLSYSHQDEELCKQFLEHLSQLEREGLIAPWSDQLITAGEDWAGAINENLNAAHVIILLVSRGFLASKYCNDVEMDRAMERDRKGEARVIPLILRPCDWKTSRFGRLQAMPKGARPVVDWKTRDHGFLDAVERLRRLIQQICNPSLPPVRIAQTAVRLHPWRWAGVLVLASMLLAGWWMLSNSQRYLKQATGLLNVGRYADARPALEKTTKWNPLSRTARCGLAAVEVDALRPDRVQFELRLGEATLQYPQCAYLKVLSGDQKYLSDDRAGALAEYQEAVKREPGLAEAYFDIGRILEVEANPDGALKFYEKAAELSRTPYYHNNLADLYFRRGDYDKAIEQYGQVANFPLAALETAKIYRLQHKLEAAAERAEDAIRWLKDPNVQTAEQPHAWALEVSPEEQVRLVQLEEKQCYAELELALTQFLQGDENEAASKVRTTIGKSGRCRSRQWELTGILSWELHRLGGEVPQLRKGCNEFAAKYLGVSTN